MDIAQHLRDRHILEAREDGKRLKIETDAGEYISFSVDASEPIVVMRREAPFPADHEIKRAFDDDPERSDPGRR